MFLSLQLLSFYHFHMKSHLCGNTGNKVVIRILIVLILLGSGSGSGSGSGGGSSSCSYSST